MDRREAKRFPSGPWAIAGHDETRTGRSRRDDLCFADTRRPARGIGQAESPQGRGAFILERVRAEKAARPTREPRARGTSCREPRPSHARLDRFASVRAAPSGHVDAAWGRGSGFGRSHGSFPAPKGSCDRPTHVTHTCVDTVHRRSASTPPPDGPSGRSRLRWDAWWFTAPGPTRPRR